MTAPQKLIVSLAPLGLATFASGQITGPTPLAWRWMHTSPVAPSGAPLFAGELIYLAIGNRVYAIEASSGNEKWKFPRAEMITGAFSTSPVLVGNKIICGTDAAQFHAVDALTGNKLWSYMLPTEKIAGQPVGTSNAIVFAQRDGLLNAIDATTGEPAWGSPMKIEGGMNGAIAAYGDNVLVCTNDNRIVSISATTQKTNWNIRFGQLEAGVKPTVYGDTIYVNSGPYLVAVNANRGTSRWQVNVGETLMLSPAVSAEGVMTSTRNGKLFFFTLSGTRALRQVVDLGSIPTVAPAPAGKMYIVPTANGALNLIDPRNGDISWSFVVRPVSKVKEDSKPVFTAGGIVDLRTLSVNASSSPVLHGNTLYAPMTDGSLLAFDNELGVDVTPPDIAMLWPPQGAQISGIPPLEFIFKLSDEATGVDIKTLKILVDDVPLTFTVGRDLVAYAKFSNTDPKANKPLKDGRKVIKVTVSDWKGNSDTKTYSLSIDNQLPPLRKPGEAAPGTPGTPGRGGKNPGAGGGARGGVGLP